MPCDRLSLLSDYLRVTTLEGETIARMERFRDAVASELHDMRRTLELEQTQIEERLEALPINDSHHHPALEELEIIDKDLYSIIVRYFKAVRAEINSVTNPTEHSDAPESPEESDFEPIDPSGFEIAVEAIAQNERDEVERLSSLDSSAAKVAQLSTALDELKARSLLKDRLAEVEADHDRIIEAGVIRAAQGLCGTQALTLKVKDLAKAHVESVVDAFDREISSFKLRESPVRLVLDRSQKGISYLKVELVGAEETAAGDILSEGERQVVALSGFLADLSAIGDSSALVFDDPMSSLDHRYRKSLARRLLIEAQQRQVIVFTHDTIFINVLNGEAELWEKELAAGVADHAGPLPEITIRHIVRDATGAGVVDDQAGWRDPSVKDRLVAIDAEWAEAKALYEAHDEAGYESAAKRLLKRFV